MTFQLLPLLFIYVIFILSLCVSCTMSLFIQFFNAVERLIYIMEIFSDANNDMLYQSFARVDSDAVCDSSYDIHSPNKQDPSRHAISIPKRLLILADEVFR